MMREGETEAETSNRKWVGLQKVGTEQQVWSKEVSKKYQGKEKRQQRYLS